MVAATGAAGIITPDMVKPGAVAKRDGCVHVLAGK
ncbi:hypothetical protein QP786_06300 [Gleimia europaea]|nr:hypothetical protein [Gleimia europaea]